MRFPAPSNLKFKILTVLLLTFYFLLFTSSASAQSPNPNPYLNPNTNPDVPKNLHTWTQTVMIEVMSAMSCQLTGIDPTDPKGKCLGVDPKTGNIGFVEGGGGAIGVAGKMIAMLYTPPLHTSDYFRYLASNFGIAKPAQAAGFEGLKPVQSLWVAFRNVVYLLFVIIFIVIGLAIMLRVRIDPRTVMTIQNQIPKIIVGILLLTFSFAIAGFLIDLMYVVIFLSYEVISEAVKGTSDLDKLNPLVLQGATPFTAADGVREGGIVRISWDVSASIFSIVSGIFSDFLRTFVAMLIPEKALEIGGRVIAGIFTGGLTEIFNLILSKVFDINIFNVIFGGLAAGAGKVVGFLAGFIAFFIIAFALLFVLIRLWLVLIMAYVSILLNIVFAPFWIAATLLPGSPIGFGAWLRSIIANLAAFPATIIMFLLARAFIDGFGECKLPACNPDTAFVPPLVGNLAGTETLGAIIGLGIIFMTDDVVRLIRAALRAPATPLGAIGAAVGAGTRTVSSPLGIIGHIGTGAFSYALSQKVAQRLPGWLGGAAAGGGGGGGGAGPCLPGNSPISTPNGHVLIKDLRVGDFVWTIDKFGRRVQTIIVKNAKRVISKGHKMAHIILKDGRELIVSPGHPTIDYREIGSLVKGEDLDMSCVASIKVMPYKDKYTYDILPYGDTGGYFANNILIGSTLSDQFQKKKHHKLYALGYLKAVW